MNYSKTAALSLRKTRSALEKQHKQVLVAEKLKPQPSEFSQNVETLRLEVREALIKSTLLSRSLQRRMDQLNMANVAVALSASFRLNTVCTNVLKTLENHDKRA